MKSLYVKLVITTIVIMILSGLVAFLLSNFYYQQKLKPDNDEKNTNIALDMVDYIEGEADMNLDRYLTHMAAAGYQILLTDEGGTDTYYGASFREKELSAQTKQHVLDGDIYHGILEFPQETFVTGFFANELKNTIGVPLEIDDKQYAMFIRPDIKLLFNEMHGLFAWMLVLTIVLSIIFVLISTKYLVHPLSKITQATEQLSEGKFDITLEIRRNDEIGQLSKSFTHMARQLEALDDMKNEFISNISHDIQSPLSNIKGYSNLLEKNSLSKADRAEYLTIINQEITRLSNLTKQLLLLASLDNQDELLKKKTYSLSKQLKEVIRSYQWHLDRKGIMVSFTLPDVYIYGDPSLLYNVWENLLSNAIKYNQKNGSIDITIINHDSGVEVRYQDTGTGISEHMKQRIFDRFYREDTARTRVVEGTGLGLSIVASIIKLHDGYMEVESVKGEGSVFTVLLPQL